MHPVNFIAGKFLEQPIGQHPPSTAKALFGGLEDENRGSVKIAGFGKMLGRRKQHGGMRVMPAGVHDAIGF